MTQCNSTACHRVVSSIIQAFSLLIYSGESTSKQVASGPVPDASTVLFIIPLHTTDVTPGVWFENAAEESQGLFGSLWLWQTSQMQAWTRNLNTKNDVVCAGQFFSMLHLQFAFDVVFDVVSVLRVVYADFFQKCQYIALA